MTKILLADDVQLFLALEKTFLARRDYEFLTATRGVDALALFREHRPELSIIERDLPETDAFELRKALLQEDDLGRTPMIVTSSKADEAMREHAQELGIDVVLRKPFTVEELTGAVYRLLPARRRRHHRLEAHLEVGLRTESTVLYLRGETINISQGGMLVLVDEPLSMGQTVGVQFPQNSGEPIVVRAVVVRYAKEQRREGRCFGLEIVEISDRDRGRWEGLVAAYGARGTH